MFYDAISFEYLSHCTIEVMYSNAVVLVVNIKHHFIFRGHPNPNIAKTTNLSGSVTIPTEKKSSWSWSSSKMSSGIGTSTNPKPSQLAKILILSSGTSVMRKKSGLPSSITPRRTITQISNSKSGSMPISIPVAQVNYESRSFLLGSLSYLFELKFGWSLSSRRDQELRNIKIYICYEVWRLNICIFYVVRAYRARNFSTGLILFDGTFIR